MSKKNNLFSFATSELSQDAIIAWLCNFINDPSAKLYPCAQALLQMISGSQDLDLSGEIEVERQVKKIDVLIRKAGEWAIIVEDKISSSHHSDQLQKYIKALQEDANYAAKKIIVCYFKTGFHYDYDFDEFCDFVDVRVTGKDFLVLLQEYAGLSEILDDYIAYLAKSCQWYENVAQTLSAGDYPEALQHQYGQHLLLKSIFQQEGKGDPYLRYGASIGGRPWSHYAFAGIPFSCPDGTPFHIDLFYRADYKWINKQRHPFLALRQYCRYTDCDKEAQENIKTLKRENFAEIRTLFQQTLQEFPQLKATLGGDNGGYYESEVGAFFLGSAGNSHETLLQYLPPFHRSLMAKLQNAYPSYTDATRFVKRPPQSSPNASPSENN